MYLKSLELTGFKSFAGTKVEFPAGITAVVGPNGTGKSNVVDSILWVLGEQSTKTLRSERMEDVIFNGTQTRKPLGMAEVSLIVSGMGDLLPPGVPSLEGASIGGFHEVMLTRRLYRNGESEYLINKTLCRLKDIRGLLLDTRAGIKGHTIIEQGRLQQILDASPQERRALIEETAGIVRYKKQKAEALRKLDSTQQNLLRVRDIIGEVKKQLNSLDRQARQARTYQTLQQEARTLEIQLLFLDYRHLVHERSEVEAHLSVLEGQEAEKGAEEGALGAKLEEVRLKILDSETAVSLMREQVADLDQRKSQAVTAMEVERNRQGFLALQRSHAQEESLRLMSERERTETRIAELEEEARSNQAELTEREGCLSEAEEAGRTFAGRRLAARDAEEAARKALLDAAVQIANGRNALSSLERSQEELKRRTARLAREVEELEAQHRSEAAELADSVERRKEIEEQIRGSRLQQEGARAEIQKNEALFHSCDEQLNRWRQELAAVTSRLKALQGVFREETGYGRDGEEQNTSLRAACHGVRAAVAEWLIVPPGLERAIEAVLGERVRGWLVEQPSDAKPAIEFLKASTAVRGAFVPCTPRVGRLQSGDTPVWWPILRERQGVVGRATELVHINAAWPDVLTCLFERVVIVETLNVALDIWTAASWASEEGPLLVTRDGEMLEPSGVMIGGLGNPAHAVLQRRREIEELQAQQGRLSQDVDQTESRRTALYLDGETAKQTLERHMTETVDLESQLLAGTKDEAARNLTVLNLVRRVEAVRFEQESAEKEAGSIEAERSECLERLTLFMQQQERQETTHSTAAEERQRIETESQAWQSQLTELRLAVETARTALHHSREDRARLLRELEESAARLNALTHQVEALDQQAVECERELERNTALFRQLDGQSRELHEALIVAQDAHTSEVGEVRQVEAEIGKVRGELLETRNARSTAEIRRAELKTRMDALENTLVGTYQLAVSDALAEQPKLEEGGETEETRHAVSSVSLRDELTRIRERIERMGPINLAAIDEHRELEERYRFLTTQEADLAESIKSLKEIISRINRTTKELFIETFSELQVKFGDVFSRFFPGGRAELVLVDPEETGVPDDDHTGDGNREPGVDIVAQPPGKRLKSISMLSGGEKTLTAMALIFASFLIKPTPFCILDEIDAPLDEENIGRFTAVVKELAQAAQFIVITHNKRTMAIADSLFGVTMEEPGVSKMVSVRLADLQPA